MSCDVILNVGRDTLFVEIAFGCNSHFSDERALKYENTVRMKYSASEEQKSLLIVSNVYLASIVRYSLYVIITECIYTHIV